MPLGGYRGVNGQQTHPMHPFRRARQTDSAKATASDFTAEEMLPLNSPAPNPVDYQ